MNPSNLPGYITRDAGIEARRKQQHMSASGSATGISRSDATAGLQYARYLRDQRFKTELNALRRRDGVPERSADARGFPLGNRGKAVYENIRRELGDMARFGKDVEHRAIVEQLILLGAKP